MTRGEQKTRFYMLANEVTGAPLLNTGDGSGGTTQTQDAALNLLLDEGQDWLAMYAFPLIAEGTFATTAGQRNYMAQAATTGITAGRSLFDWHTAVIGSNTLIMVRETSLRTIFRGGATNYATAANGTPTYSYRNARGLVGLFVPPTAALSVKLMGYALPTKYVNDSSTPTFLIEPDHELIAFYALLRAAKKRIDDPILAQRLLPYQEEFLARCDASYLTLDPILREAHFPLTPRAALQSTLSGTSLPKAA